MVMLCNIIEGGKVRCFDYTANRKAHTHNGEDVPITISSVQLEEGEYSHVHYSEWPDRSVPEDVGQVADLLQELEKYERVGIHCSAGLGRSGVIACLLSLAQQVRAGEEISVFATALRLREHRFGAIQNSEQYAYLYRFLTHLHRLYSHQ
jgi:protein tyrosine phosphatase